MSSADTPALSRRQFLGACGACGTVGVVALGSTPAAADDREQLSSGDAGAISPEGQAAIAAVDRELQQEGDVGQTVNAVSDLGLDPQGNTPISQPLEAAAGSLSNARIVFPSDGVFRVADRIVLDPAGPVELVGNGATLKIDPETKARAFNCPRLPSGTRIRGFVIDMTASGALSGLRIGTEGTVEVRDVTLKGFAEPNSTSKIEGILMPIARNPSATVRVTNFTAVGGTAAGMHDDSSLPASAPANRLGSPMGLWVGQASTGTVQLVNPQLRGWNNGTYAGRTKGRVEIRGGMLWNNENAQARVGGGAIIDGTTMLLDDRRWSQKRNPGPYTLGGHQGVHAIRVETGGSTGNQSAPVQLVNLDIRGVSMGKGSALIDVEGGAPAVRITNSRLTNQLDRPAIYGAAPGSKSGEPAPQTNILVDQSLIQGRPSSEVIDVNQRPASRIQRTCIKVPGAGPGSISGIQIGSGIGFGRTCSAGGLADPSAVGSGGNISAMNLSAVNGSVALPSRGAGKGGIIKAMVTTVFMVIAALAGVGVVALALAALAVGGLAIVSYLMVDE